MQIWRLHWVSAWGLTRSMAINRRQWLGLAVVTALAPRHATLAGQGKEPQAGKCRLYLAARKYMGHYEAVLVTEEGAVLRSVRLAGRGHSFAINSDRRLAVAFARQPGTQAVAFSCNTNKLDEPATVLHTPPGRHFSGHGVLSADGNVLYAAENDFEAGRGVIGIYQRSKDRPSQFKRVEEWDSGGIGPHEIILDADTGRLCVANGGLLTHPDYDKLVLNRDTMLASLTYLDLANGQVTSTHSMPATQHKQSIRHLVQDHQGTVWFGCQYQGSRAHQIPLVGFHSGAGPLEWVKAPDAVWHAMQHYVGSIAFDPITRVVAASSPVGGVVAYWHAERKTFLAMHKLPDGCGVAPALEGGFIVNSGHGQWAYWRPGLVQPKLLQTDHSIAWDHHLRTLGNAT